jgi:flagellar motor switch protein FliM
VPRLERIETNSQFAQLISPTEMIAIVTISMRVGDAEGLMNVILPFAVLEPVMDKLNTKYWFSNMQNKDVNTYEDAISSLISKAQIPIKAVLGNSSISVNDFINLNVGDIIRLNCKVDEELDVYVGNIRKFTALPGSINDNYAVRLTNVLRGDED